MNTLLIRLIAPMQSWGVQSNFDVRDSGLEPSKSGVIGLICSALGRPREAPLEDLTVLKMGVRIDREGSLRRDYQIAQDVLEAKGTGTKPSLPSNRYYLSNAAFLVGLEGENVALLEQIQHALQHPKWATFLGRKSFTPSAPVWLNDGLRFNQELEDALKSFGWIYAWKDGVAPEKLRFVMEDAAGEQVRTDVPISFAERRFSSRRVTTRILSAPTSLAEEVL
jgi:CRISPR system Cascade subunit CasD